MTFWRGFPLLIWLALTGALSAADPRGANAAAAGKGRVVVLGDSITAGYGLSPAEAWPALLQQKIDAAKLPFTVVNAGVSGDTTAGGLRRINWALGASGADVLVIALGGNDGLRGIAPKQTEENLTGIVTKAREKSPKVKVVITGMQMPGSMGREFAEQFSGVFPRVAKEKGAALVPFLLAGVGGVAKLNQPDQIHPTAEGQRIVAENVWKVLEDILKVPAAESGGGKPADF